VTSNKKMDAKVTKSY